MPNDLGGPGPSVHLLRSKAQDFQALSEMIGRTIQVMDDESPEDVERLHRARQAADKGIALAKKAAKFR
ncbi:MAG: hypothetical protein ACJ8EH_12465 [Sphingomicrobium sp.]